ncbi:MAG: CapA family protein [Candidatus Cloacimonetes bacterium]|nr:CapA family protein [Candidatus Cloacimonadota bacterium]
MKFISFVIILFLVLSLSSTSRFETIEDFDFGDIELLSYEDEDIDENDWEINDEITYENSPYSLRLYGNTWKLQIIEPIVIDSGSVISVHTFVENISSIQGFGLVDSENNVLLYSLFGTEVLDIEEWIPVYQGSQTDDEWNEFQLPIADDWLAFFDVLPEITGLIYINDCDNNDGNVYFDSILNVTEDLPKTPLVSIYYEIESISGKRDNFRNVEVQFHCEVIDPDSEEHSYLWHFGDGNFSVETDPIHIFTIEDDHEYSVFLKVTDEASQEGYATCVLTIDEGESSFPITMNFVGDIMLARYMENVINSQGLEAIFDQTLDILGENADLTIANLECPFTTYPYHHPTKTIFFKANPNYAQGLDYAGIDIVTLANNHIYDYMEQGLIDTQETLDELGILHSGAGLDTDEAYLPLFYSISGKTFAFLASSDRTGQYNNYQPYLQAGFNKAGFAYMTPYYVQKQIEQVRDVVDFVVIETHSGSEYSTGPGENYDKEEVFDTLEDEEYSAFLDVPHMWDMEIRHFMIDAGADLVICHHPHIIQGLEVYNDKLIAHSLGNFIFDLSYSETMPSMILNTKIDERGFYEYTVSPIFIDDFIPQKAEGELGLHILDIIARRSKELGTIVDVDRENIIASVVMDTEQVQTTFHNHNIGFSTAENNGMYYSAPIKLVRDGSIDLISSITPSSNWEYRLGREIVWFGNMEDEGCSLWNLNSDDEWFDYENSYEGERSIRHRKFNYSGYNTVTNFEKRIKRYSDEYSLHGFIKTENGSDVTIEIRYYETRTQPNYISTESVGTYFNGDNDWTYVYKDLDVPDEANYFDIRVNSDMPVLGEAKSWFDNVGIIEWTDWNEFNIFGSSVAAPNDFYFMQTRTDEQPLGLCSISYREINYHYDPNVDFSQNILPLKSATLYQNYPNPFNPTTNFSFTLKTPGKINLDIYNIKGQKVKSLLNTDINSGKHFVQWNGKNNNEQNVASGIYLYRLTYNDVDVETRKCLLIK